MRTHMLIALLSLQSLAFAQEGMTVVRDRETGQLRAPTAAELRELRRSSAQPQVGPVRPQSVVRPDGTRKLELGERGMVYSIIERSADGKLKRLCVNGGDAAQEVLHQSEEKQHDHP
jgi:hypothetical protein